MKNLRSGLAVAVLHSSLVHLCYAAVPASNAAQSSVLSQQAYNLCLYENSIGFQSASCTSFGVSGMTPSKTATTSNAIAGTFVASFLTDYGGLACPTTITTSIDGVNTELAVGALGQVWVKLNSSVNIPYPTVPPQAPVNLVTGTAACTSESSVSSKPRTSNSATIQTSARSKPATSISLSTGVFGSSLSSRPSLSTSSIRLSTGVSSVRSSSKPASNTRSRSSVASSFTSSLSSSTKSSTTSFSSIQTSISSGTSSAISSGSISSRASSSSSQLGSKSSTRSSISAASPSSTSGIPPLTSTSSRSTTSFSSTSLLSSGESINLPTITSFASVSTSSTSSVSGVTTNQAIQTRDDTGAIVAALVFFPCLIFCSGGLGAFLVFGVGPAPGLYFPPALPAILIGADGIPTPDPSASLPSTTSKPTSTSSSISSCQTQTASACSTQCVDGGSCSTTCSPVTTGCSATCTGSSCSAAATVTIASWTTNEAPDNDLSWVPASAFDSAAASSVASGIDALLLSWGIIGSIQSLTSQSTVSITSSKTSSLISSTRKSSSVIASTTKSSSVASSITSSSITTFVTSTKVSSILSGSSVSGTSYGPGVFCEGLSPGGGDTCITIPAGCYIAVPSYNVIPDVMCTSTMSSVKKPLSTSPPSSTTTTSSTSSSSSSAPTCKFGTPNVSDCQNAIAKIGTGSTYASIQDSSCYTNSNSEWCPVAISDNAQCEIYVTWSIGQGNALTPPPQEGALTDAANGILAGSICGAGGGQWTDVSMTPIQVGVCVKSPGYDCDLSS